MLQRTLRVWATRTAGYVFWRQDALQELERTRRDYLWDAKPIAVAEVARRMVRVRARYEATHDEHERTLLRGEYKYFSGKLCDLTSARVPDLLAMLQCGAFFGFADTSQLDTVCAHLQRRLDELTANEHACLFACLPGLHRQGSELYARVAAELIDVVPSLTMDECMRVCAACNAAAIALRSAARSGGGGRHGRHCPPRAADDDNDDEQVVPAALQHNLLARIESDVAQLTPRQVVDALSFAADAPATVQQHFVELYAALATRVAALADALAPLDVAIVYDALTLHRLCSRALQQQLLTRFVQCMTSTCARSTATVFATVHRSSLSSSFATALWLAHAMAHRVVFLATDYTVAELLAVYRVYMTCLTSMCAVVDEHDAASSSSSSAAAADAVARAEATAARQRHVVLRHVVDELTSQLHVLLTESMAYVGLDEQLDLLDVYATAVEERAAAMATRSGDDGNNNDSNNDDDEEARAAAATRCAASRLLRDVPGTRANLRALSTKLIATLRAAPLRVLVRVLQLVHALGPYTIDDALAAAAVHELMVRDVGRLRRTPQQHHHKHKHTYSSNNSSSSDDDAMAFADALEALTNLRAEHQRRLHSTVVPRLRGVAVQT